MSLYNQIFPFPPHLLLLAAIFFIVSPQVVQGEIVHFVFFDPDTESKDPLTAVSAMKPFADFIGEDIGKEIKVHYFLRKSDLDQFFAEKEVGIGLLSPLYIVENKDRYGLEPFGTPFLAGETTYQLLLVTTKASGYQNLQDLKGKSLAYTAVGEANQDFLNLLVFNKQISIHSFFSKILEVTSASSAVMSVLYRNADCALVTSGLFETMKELNPRIGKDLQGVYLSPKIQRPSMCFVRDILSPEIKTKVSEVLFKMHETALGQQTLMPFKVDGFKPVSMDVFLPMETLLASVKSTPQPQQQKKAAVKIEKVKIDAAAAPSSLTFKKITHKFLSDKGATQVTARVSPADKIDKVELIYQIGGQERITVQMNSSSTGHYSSLIKMPEATSEQKISEVVHMVKAGETLGTISKKYYGEMKKWIMIATYNQLNNPNLIFVDQKLRIKLGGEFENVMIKVWIKGTAKSGEISISPEKTFLITR
ncbi:PhnD/SsuA/transferrin family substrate-binding protein [candidate division CSSED10-310 bacterium]|uniref:PhnD/SsuA/transferrin family substrate-binding protein n=1 Tax=candidate division CSSED10-310 bacterium TaxID=2855610 RepID=A0ABV6YT58_UNCC1